MLRIYHNPRCSKSRAALNYLNERNIKVQIIEYLKEGLQEKQLAALLTKLGLSAEEILRKNEAEYKEYDLANASDAQILAKICEYPNLLERPVIEGDNKAVIARPIENLYEFLEEEND